LPLPFHGTTEAELVSWLRQILADVGGKLVRRYGTKGRDVRLERDLVAVAKRKRCQIILSPRRAHRTRHACSRTCVP
jgi:hypothetical protein